MTLKEILNISGNHPMNGFNVISINDDRSTPFMASLITADYVLDSTVVGINWNMSIVYVDCLLNYIEFIDKEGFVNKLIINN